MPFRKPIREKQSKFKRKGENRRLAGEKRGSLGEPLAKGINSTAFDAVLRSITLYAAGVSGLWSRADQRAEPVLGMVRTCFVYIFVQSRTFFIFSLDFIKKYRYNIDR